MIYLCFDLCEHWRIKMVDEDGGDTFVCLIDNTDNIQEFAFGSERKVLVRPYCERNIVRNDDLSRCEPDDFQNAATSGELI